MIRKKVVDLRTGLMHPTRDASGRRVSYKRAAVIMRVWEEWADTRPCTWVGWVQSLCRMRIW
jgi:hypothetical protein